jgi:siroheme synthase
MEAVVGKVFLVGAGPGDPDLLTVRALRLLQQADIVLHDALVSPEILALSRTPEAPQPAASALPEAPQPAASALPEAPQPAASALPEAPQPAASALPEAPQPAASALPLSRTPQIIDIGKRCGTKLLTQQEINTLLVAYASKYEVVVRLKGGDPSIFGRAGEEIEALVEANVPFEIVPGITSAIASAAAAGISLTDRRHAASVVFITAHRGAGAEAVAWDKLVASESTLAIYMPGSGYQLLSARLCAAGLNPRTPCTIVSHASRPSRQVRYCDLTSLASLSPQPAPALLIVGECARQLHCALDNAALDTAILDNAIVDNAINDAADSAAPPAAFRNQP